MAGSISAGTIYVDVRPDTSGLTSSSTTSKLGSAMGKLAGVAAGAFAAKKVLDFGMDLVHSAEEAAAANKKSLTLIQADADKTAIHFDKLTAWSENFGDGIGQDDEAITSLASKIASSFDLKKMFGANGAQAGLEELTTGIVNVSAALDKPQKMVTKLFQTIGNDPAGAVTQLQKLGVITADQADHFKKMVENGNAAQVSQELLTLTQKKYEGAAAAGATVSQKLSVVWDNLKETLGKFLLPLFSKLVGWLIDGVEWFQRLVGGGKEGAAAMGGLTSALKPVLDVGKQVWAFFKDDLMAVWQAIVDVYNKNLKPALDSLWAAFKKLLPVLKFVLGVYIAIQAIVLKLALKVLPVLIRIIGVVIQVLAKLIEWVADLVGWLADKLGGAFLAVGRFAVQAWNTMRAAWDGVVDFFSGIWDGVKYAAASAWNFIANAWNSTIGSLSFRAPSWVPVIGGKGWDVPDIPTVALARGGIVSQPTSALIGEAGPEAVIPLRGRTLDVRVVNPHDFPDGSGAAALASRMDRTRR